MRRRRRMARRPLAVLLTLWLLLSGLGGRLWQLQLTRGPVLAGRADGQQAQRLLIDAPRGVIRDRHGVPLSDPREYHGLAVFPRLITDAPVAAEALAPTLGLATADLRRQLAAAREPFWLDRRLDPATAAAVEALHLPGVSVAPVHTRYGPGALAQHLVGYINAAGGQLGLEAVYDQWLQGEGGMALEVTLDGRRRPLAGLGIRPVSREGRPPGDLTLTLDAGIQRAVEQAMTGVERGAAVVLDAHSGDILALVSRPGFDPADPAAATGDAPLLNRALAAYEPGSTFKVLVAGAALEEGLATLDSGFYCPGVYDMGDYQPHCDVVTGHGQLNLEEALAVSCNVTFITLGVERLGRQRLLAWARRFGFGALPGVGAFGEQAGVLPALDLPGDVAQFSFGQALTASPLQIARLLLVVANGGVDPGLRLIQAGPPGAGARPTPMRLLSPATAAALQRALRGVADPDGIGTGKAAWVPGPGSAGKTGTAQGVVGGAPASHAWFAGYTPADDPKYVIAVFLEGGGYGGLMAAPLFRQVAEAIFAVAPAGNS